MINFTSNYYKIPKSLKLNYCKINKAISIMEQDQTNNQELFSCDDQDDSYISIKKQCPYFYKASLVCCNTNCNEQSLVCQNQKCKCLEKFHPKCTMISLQSLTEKIRRKRKLFPEKTSITFNTIYDKINQLIDYLSEVRVNIQNYLQRVGWSEDQKKFMDALYNDSSNSINGSFITEIRKNINWKASSRDFQIMDSAFYEKNFDKMAKKIQSSLMNQMQLIQFMGKTSSIKFINDFKTNAVDMRKIKNIISKTTLEKLHIQWCTTLSKQKINQIIQAPTLMLKELRLQYCSNFQQKMVQKVVTNHPNIQYFQYGVDYRRSYRAFQQAQYFMALGKQKELKQPSLESCIELSKLPNLKNIWIIIFLYRQINVQNKKNKIIISDISCLKQYCRHQHKKSIVFPQKKKKLIYIMQFLCSMKIIHQIVLVVGININAFLNQFNRQTLTCDCHKLSSKSLFMALKRIKRQFSQSNDRDMFCLLSFFVLHWINEVIEA